MKRFRQITISLAFASLNLTAYGQITFQEPIGILNGSEFGKCAQQTIDGGYIMAGTYSIQGGSAAYLVKTDSSGAIEWTRTYGSGLNTDWANSVVQAYDSGYLVVGQYYNDTSDYDIYLIRTNSTGDTLWTKILGNEYADKAYSVQNTSDSGFILCGVYGLGGPNYSPYAILIKLNSSGNILWSKCYGNGYEFAYSVHQTFDGGYIFTGGTIHTGGRNIYLVKTDANGTKIWAKNLNILVNALGYDVNQTTDSGYIITGTSNNFTNGDGSIFLIKTNSIGDVQWAKKYLSSNGAVGSSVLQAADGGYVLSGCLGGDEFLIKTNLLGDTLWTKYFPKIGIFNGERTSLQTTNDNGFVIASTSSSFQNTDMLLIKTDSLGNSVCMDITKPITVSNLAVVGTDATTNVYSTINFHNGITLVDSGGFITMNCNTVGIEETLHNNSYMIYPNPSDGNLTIQLNETKRNASIQICNLIGDVIYNKSFSTLMSQDIHLQNISNGIYFVKLFDGQTQRVMKLIIGKV